MSAGGPAIRGGGSRFQTPTVSPTNTSRNYVMPRNNLATFSGLQASSSSGIQMNAFKSGASEVNIDINLKFNDRKFVAGNNLGNEQVQRSFD